MVAEGHHHARHAFGADHADLDAACRRLRDYRGDALFNEVDGADRSVGLLQFLPERELHQVQIRTQEREIVRRQGGDEPVAGV